jgi:uncharacterized protein (TIGR02147 family)
VVKSLFEYTNYRKYLQDYYEYHKAHTRYFSFRYFSGRAGFSSPSQLKLIINGERNLSPESIEKFARALKLGKKEGGYFRALVNFNQAKSEQARDMHFRELMRSAAGTHIRQVGEGQYEFYSKWYHSAIRELVAMPGFKEDPVWIAGQLTPSIKPLQAKKSLKLLKDLGLIKYEKPGNLAQSEPLITSGDEVKSLMVRNFHRQMTGLAQEALERVPREKREISSITIGISEKTFRELKERIAKFEDEMLEMVGQDQAPSRHVYQLNYQLFPLTNGDGEGAAA